MIEVTATSTRSIPDLLTCPEAINGTEAGVRGRSGVLAFWLAVIALFFVNNTSVDWYQQHLERSLHACQGHLPARVATKLAARGVPETVTLVVERVIVPGRATVYFAALVVLLWPLRHGLGAWWSEVVTRRRLRRAVGVCGALLVLGVTVPLTSGLALASIDPFSQSSGWFYRRLLAPAVAYFVHLNGYLLFPVFMSLCVLLLVMAIMAWFEREGIELSIGQWVALFSAGLLMHFAYGLGARPEGAVVLLGLVALMLPLNQYGRGALTVLMLCTHEAAAVCLLVPLAGWVYPRRERWVHGLLVAGFILFWLLNFGFDLPAAVRSQALIGNQYAYEGSTGQPGRVLLGVLFAHKALWVMVALAVYGGLRQKQYREVWVIAVAVLFPLVQLAIAYDTSRLVAFGFLGVLAAVGWCRKQLPAWAFNGVLGLNVLWPSLDIGLWGIQSPALGLYRWVEVFR